MSDTDKVSHDSVPCNPPGDEFSREGALYPLDFVYRCAGVGVPDFEPVKAVEIPEPARSLLDHETDMTLTLEAHYGRPIVLRTLCSCVHEDSYFRRVLLVHGPSGRPVEMGAIRIHLNLFRDDVRQRILENHVPLGRILHEENVLRKSRPQTFLRVTPNPEMMGVFWMPEPETLYGRRTVMFIEGAEAADIVEILPTPWSPDDAG
jgi:hypothetical protein